MRITLLLTAFLFLKTVSGQKVEKAIGELTKKYPQEKVVVSFPKPEYLAGETIDFKAYVLTGYVPTTISTNLYAEIYDKNKTLLDKQILPIVNGAANGSFVLPSSMPEDVYYIRSYTQWMLNFDEAFQYIKPISVYNPYSHQSLHPKPVQWTARGF